MFKKIIYLGFFLSLFSCKKEEVNELLLSVTPDNFTTVKKPNEVISFQVHAKTNEQLSNLLITQREENSLEIDTLKNVSISGNDSKTQFLYKLSELEDDTTLIYLTFKVTQTNGKEKIEVRRVLNIKAEKTLIEKSGNVFYSHKTVATQADAYNLIAATSEFSNLAVVTEKQIMDDTLSSGTEALSKAWISPAGAKFRKDNGFDYVNATSTSVKNSFESGQALDKVTDIKNGDIILVKLEQNGTVKYFAIKLTGVIDDAGILNDRYEFNYKM